MTESERQEYETLIIQEMENNQQKMKNNDLSDTERENLMMESAVLINELMKLKTTGTSEEKSTTTTCVNGRCKTVTCINGDCETTYRNE